MSKQIVELLEMSKTHRELKNPAGLIYADEAYELSEETQNLPLKINALREKLNYAYSVNANFVAAEKIALEILALSDADKDLSLSVTFNILGVCNDVRGNYLESRNYYLKTIVLLSNNDSLSFDNKVVLGNAYCNLAKLYSHLDENEELWVYLEKARGVFESAQFADGLARIWNIRASHLPDNAPMEERLALFEKAYSYFEKGKDKHGQGACLANIGLSHCRLGRFDTGLAYLADSVELLKKLSNKAVLAFTYFQLGEANRFKKDHLKAIDYLKLAEETLLGINAKVYLNVIYQEWATNLAAIGNFEEAYEKSLKFNEQVNERVVFDRQSAVAEAHLKFELEKKEKESELLRKKNEEIELYNEKLKHSSAELNQFAYVASHDLKEPLRMVSNYMQLLEKSMNKQLTEDQTTYIRYANEGAKRMYKLIDSLLVFSRSTIDTEKKLVDLNDVVDQVRRIVLSSVKRHVQVDSDQLPTILGDHSQMVQLFQNLIANAVKYNDKEEVFIHISYTPQQGIHRFSVEDNGIGIPHRYRETVFEIFKRLHDRESYSGTGIGLSICRKIIHSFNGRIWIEDGVMGGSAFVFTIPKQSLSA
ncbi:MAG: multi-sensor signal transduction histidine kinase [Bacteroidota bacterium]|nr:multi-sensor signal transduction histidine kinase [Bacteroidota bacterium]